MPRQSTDPMPLRTPLGDLGKLPAEIRNEIYKLCLTAPTSVTVTRAIKERGKPYTKVLKNGACKHRKEPSTYGVKCTIPGPVRRTKERVLPVSSAVNVGLLRTSKAINQEATPMLYYFNSFDFGSTIAVGTFFEQFGKNAKFMADLTVHKVHSEANVTYTKVLARIERPKRVVLHVKPCMYGYHPVDASKISYLIRPFIKGRFNDQTSTTASPTSSTAKEQQRFDTLEFDVSDIESIWDSERKRGVEVKEDGQRKARFRQEMLKSLHKDLQQALARQNARRGRG